jgi:hypothetical protein
MTAIDYPGATDTAAFGINTKEQIVGIANIGGSW